MKQSYLLAVLCALAFVSTGCGDGDNGGGAATRTATATATAVGPTATPSGLASPTPVVTATVPVAATATVTVVSTATSTPAPTVIPVPPVITYLGVARADDLIQTTDLVDAVGRPIYARVQGQGLTIIVEAKEGSRPIPLDAYDPLGGAPALQLLVSRPLGDGSVAVCDYDPPVIGGVPGFDPPIFSDNQVVLDAINDLGCRVNDGTGQPLGRVETSACTRVDPTFEYVFVDTHSDVQYCLPIARAFNFPPGDTIVAARVRDSQGTVSAVKEIVVRVETETFGCESGLGERAFTVARAGSALFTSAVEGDVSTERWLPGPVRLCAGPDVGAGLHLLTLREDAVLGVQLVDGSTLCAKLKARGTVGALNCTAGVAHDVLAQQEDELDASIVVESGLGLPAGTGAASLRVPIALRLLPVGTTPSECAAATQSLDTFDGALTTATGTARVVDADGATVAEISASGMPFDCATWRTPGAGTLVIPFTAIDTAAGPVASVLMLSE
ncbi:MAG: hypothetical protein ACRERC_13965 [Candidatus Binatia bacterium]